MGDLPAWPQPTPGGGGGNVPQLTADTFDAYKVILLSDGSVKAIPAAAVPPAVPAGLNVTPRLSSVRVAWSAASGASGYRLYRDGSLLATPALTTYRDLSVEADETYSYRVQAVDVYGQRSALTAAVSAFVDPALNVAPTLVGVRSWPPVIPADGRAYLRVLARDANAQALELELDVDAGTLTASDDPSVWIYEPA